VRCMNCLQAFMKIRTIHDIKSALCSGRNTWPLPEEDSGLPYTSFCDDIFVKELAPGVNHLNRQGRFLQRKNHESGSTVYSSLTVHILCYTRESLRLIDFRTRP